MPSSSIPEKIDIGELRQDITTGRWVAVAKSRARRPHDFLHEHQSQEVVPKFKKGCPFCELDVYPQSPDIIRLPDDQHLWQVHVFRNKYPAFIPRDEFRSWNIGPYRALEAAGYHEVLATRWHNQIDGLISTQELRWQIEALTLRYRQLRVLPSVNYIQIIKNHGPAAGGSLEHPHHQIFTTPVLPNDIQTMLHTAERYAKKHGVEVFAAVLDFERENGERLVADNEHFTAFCPYASTSPFEVWIMPNQPNPFFENISNPQQAALADIMRTVLHSVYGGLKNPPYNYYIHSAPCDDTGFVCDREQFKHFRWHVEIVPRLTTRGGFELGTGLEITSAVPEESAAFLREQGV